MADPRQFRQISDMPPSPHRNNYNLDESTHQEYDEPFDPHNVGQGYLAPSHELRPQDSATPDFDTMPVPSSYLPSGALPPGRFYGAHGANATRETFASSQTSLNEPPRPGYAYSDYDSVTRLRRDSQADASSMATYDNPRLSHYGDSVNGFRDGEYPMDDLQHGKDKNAMYAAPQEKKEKRMRWLLILAGVLLALAAAAGLVWYFVIRKHDSSTSSGSGGGTTSGGSSSTSGGKKSDLVVTGGDGSTVTMEDGTTFVYKNSFGGTWYYDPDDPYNNNAQAQSYTPALNTTFQFGTDRLYGVNLGGWLNTEPFITPALYEPYLSNPTPAIDEWTLSVNMAADTANGGLNQLETHYATFITEKDFAEIAGAGLNFVRIPIPYWAVQKFDDEPFYSGAQWKYLVKAAAWARKYGLRINLDLHAHPGSQNGFNHAGVLGALNWMYGTMGVANAQRSLEVIRSIMEFIAQPQYQGVFSMFGLVNEPQVYKLGQDVAGHFYYQAHNLIRNITGVGEGKGPWIVIHDGFNPPSNYSGFLAGSDRIALDTHPYLCFQTLYPEGPDGYAATPCKSWGSRINGTYGTFGFVHAGEWSLGYTDCGLYLNGVGIGTRYEGTFTDPSFTRIGDCATVLDYTNWNATYKQGMKDFALAQMDVLHNWFFWNWKIGNSSVTGQIESPHWSYQLGLAEGWLPTDPRSAAGTCAAQGISVPIAADLSGYQTGGTGAGTFLPAQVQSYGDWPPSSFSGVTVMSGMPVYVQTGAPVTLTEGTSTYAPSLSPTVTASIGNGWADAADTVSAYVPISGCAYPNPWNATLSPFPSCSPAVQVAKRMFNDEAVISGVPAARPSRTRSSFTTITARPKYN